MPIVANAIYVAGHRLARPASLGTTLDELRAVTKGQDAFCWVGILRPDVEEMNTVAREFSLHPLAVEDASPRISDPRSSSTGR